MTYLMYQMLMDMSLHKEKKHGEVYKHASLNKVGDKFYTK